MRYLFATLLIALAASACERSTEPTSPPPAGPPSDLTGVPAEMQAAGYRSLVLPFVEGAKPLQAVIGDVNEDGRPDVAACGTTDEKGFIRLYLQAGEEGYEMRDLEVPENPRDLLLADLDLDGHLDLATANKSPGTVTVFWGDGEGAFTESTGLQLSQRPSALAAGDLDGDGRLDLVGVSEGGMLGVFLGRKPRWFRSRTYPQPQYGAADVRIVDLDGDDDLDLAVVIWRQNHLLIYLNEGKGTFGSPRAIELTTQSPLSVAIFDFDEDGLLDLVTADLAVGRLGVKLGSPDGTFQDGPTLPAGVGARDVQAVDLDLDGRLDLVVTAQNENRVFLHYRRGEGRIATRTPLKVGKEPHSTAAADLNGDGLPDLVTANPGSSDLTLHLSEPGETLALQPVRVASTEETASRAAFVSSVDEYETALKAYTQGETEEARSVLGKLASQGRELLLAGLLRPDREPWDFLRFHSSVLLLADLHRYRHGEPEKAREMEQRLAEEAEELGQLVLAAVEWLAVGEIDEKLLKNPGAATAAYERVLALSERARGEGVLGPPSFLVDLARLALDRLHAEEPGYKRRLAAVALPYEVDWQGGLIERLILPHVRGYRTAEGKDDPFLTLRAFADAHPDSFRGAYADYLSVTLALRFPGRWEKAGEAVLRFYGRYPEELLGFGITSLSLAVFERFKSEEGHQAELKRAKERAERLGIALTVEGEA